MSDQLRAFVERIERVEEEISALNADKRDIYAEAKGNGFDVPTIKKVVRIRKLDANERMEADALLETYLAALGMLPDYDPSRVHVHVREGSPAGLGEEIGYDADTDEITEPQVAPQPAQAPSDRVLVPDPNGVVTSLPGAEGAEDPDQFQPETANTDEPAAAVETAGDYLREPVATEQGQIIREGDAPRETDRDYSGDASRPDADFLPHPPADFVTSLTPDQIEARIRRTLAMKPECRRPWSCGTMGATACFSCLRAASETEAA